MTYYQLIKEVRELLYKFVWELKDKDLDTDNAILEAQANFVEAVVDEYNALLEV